MAVGFSDMGAHIFVEVDFSRVRGQGTVAPRLVFELEAKTTTQAIQAELHHVKVQALFESETVAEGDIAFIRLGHSGRQIVLEMPITRQALAYVTRNLGRDSVTLDLSFEGAMRVLHDSDDLARYASSPPRGEWTFLPIGRSTTGLNVRIAHSDWINNVLEPTAYGDYVVSEIRVPRGARGAAWRAAMAGIREAEEFLVMGRYADVFFHCRAALESLPGAPKNIFQFIQDEAKRKRIDDLTRELVQFLHFGRHPKPEEGFAVGNQDAQFAVAATKIVLAYASSL